MREGGRMWESTEAIPMWPFGAVECVEFPSRDCEAWLPLAQKCFRVSWREKMRQRSPPQRKQITLEPRLPRITTWT